MQVRDKWQITTAVSGGWQAGGGITCEWSCSRRIDCLVMIMLQWRKSLKREVEGSLSPSRST